MKNLLVICLLSILLTGCSAPNPTTDFVVEMYDNLTAEHIELQAKLSEQEQKLTALRNIEVSYGAVVEERDKLQSHNYTLALQYQALAAQYDTLARNYNSLWQGQGDYSQLEIKLEELNSQCESKIERLNSQYQEKIEEMDKLEKAIDAVTDKEVKFISDNLTDIERVAFYKGWGFWLKMISD